MTSNTYDRAWFDHQFRRILTGWHKALRQTADTGTVWEPTDGIHTLNFFSASNKQVDGVTRMLPALAAWAANESNPQTLELLDGQRIEPRQLVRDVFVNAFDPDCPDHWPNLPDGTRHQQQVESSVVAWSLWLSRDWLLPELDDKHVQQIQAWLAATASYDIFPGNWTLFVAVNEAVRYALRAHGFEGDLHKVRQTLLPEPLLRLPGGWTWDRLGLGIDYYNFWVFGSHDLYLQAILGDEAPDELQESLDAFAQREKDLPYLIDANGQNVLFGRSLPYRWGWLTGSVAAQYLGRSGLKPGLLRHMLGRNIQWWLDDAQSLNAHGVLREKLTAHGSDGGRSSYINCGHPYWGMQAMLCFALPEDDPFWTDAVDPLPIERGDFCEPRYGPGLVMHGRKKTGDVRLFNLRNHSKAESPHYSKYLYSTAFPANAIASMNGTLGDNQLIARLADGTCVTASSEAMRVDTGDGRTMEVGLNFIGGGLTAWVLTRIEVDDDGEVYRTHQRIDVRNAPPNAYWIEGGFALGLVADAQPTMQCDGELAWAADADRSRLVYTRAVSGWQTLHVDESPRVAKAVGLVLAGGKDAASYAAPNIVHGRAAHALLSAPVVAGRSELSAEHGASLDGAALAQRIGV